MRRILMFGGWILMVLFIYVWMYFNPIGIWLADIRFDA